MKHALVVTTAAAAALLLQRLRGQLDAAPVGHVPAQPVCHASTSQPPATSGAAPESSAAAAPSTAKAGPQLCKAASLTGTTDATGGGAAGSIYMQLILTNSGTEPCLLKGFAGVSLTAGADGEPIGAAATRDDSGPVTDVTACPGQGRHRHPALHPGRQLPGLHQDAGGRIPGLPAQRHRVAVHRRSHWTPAPTRTSTC